MPISDNDDISHLDLARIGRISAVAALRGGVLTSKQKRALARIAEQAKQREDKKRAEAKKRK
ncbi:hypothetical protein HY68_12575 [Streptomyces sp. AcH 505]|uniref:hypothetical protein n=1 Tax=Streptomyces sp. AcH 505 TaxID=352211 RepID=UPI000591B841|nr:hypothetical protein HY68_12575 [Streptomyces sp. AcH 505]